VENHNREKKAWGRERGARSNKSEVGLEIGPAERVAKGLEGEPEIWEVEKGQIPRSEKMEVEGKKESGRKSRPFEVCKEVTVKNQL